jgi:O-antigen ligase
VREGLLYLLVVSVFVESLGFGPASVGRILAVVGVYGAVLVIVARPYATRLPLATVAVPVFGLGIWVFLSVLWSDSLGAWASATGQFALAICYFVAYALLLESRAQMRRLLVAYVIGAGVVALVGLSQTSATVRAVGYQGDANMYALYELAALPIAGNLAARSRGWGRAGWFAMMALLVAAVLASQSRGGLLAVIVVTLYLLWNGDLGGIFAVRPRLTTVVGSGVLMALATIALLTIPRFSPQNSADTRGTGRLDIWHVAWQGWEQHPVLGLGAGNFIAASGDLLSSTPGVQLDAYSVLFDGIKVHNAYLEPWVELGPVGLGLYVGVLVSTGIVLFKMRHLADAGLLKACFPMLLGFATATIFLSAINNKLLWMLAGFAAVFPYLPERKSSDSSEESPLEVA